MRHCRPQLTRGPLSHSEEKSALHNMSTARRLTSQHQATIFHPGTQTIVSRLKRTSPNPSDTVFVILDLIIHVWILLFMAKQSFQLQDLGKF